MEMCGIFSYLYLCLGVSKPLVRAYGYFEVRHLMGPFEFSQGVGVPVGPSTILRFSLF